MQLSQVIGGLESAVETQLRVAGPETAELGTQLMAALQPAIRQTLMDVVAMAATEVSSQLAAQRVEVRIVDGDPELVLTPESAPPPPPPPVGDDADEARITLRLPGYLKDLISEAANTAGDSINQYVVEALKTKAHVESAGPGHTRLRTTIEL